MTNGSETLDAGLHQHDGGLVVKPWFPAFAGMTLLIVSTGGTSLDAGLRQHDGRDGFNNPT